MINSTLIDVHERTSENKRKKRTVEARYIFRDQSPSINHYTKVVILPLSQLKVGWFNSTSPAPSSSTTTATTMVTAPLSKTMVLILTISTETTTNYTTTTTAPTAKTITTIGDQETTVTVMATTMA